MLQMVEQHVEVPSFPRSSLLAVAEQVVEVPALSLPVCAVQRVVPFEPQMMEQLVEVSTVLSYALLQQQTVEQIIDIPVPHRSGGRSLEGLRTSCYQYMIGNLGRWYSSPLGAQRCSNLVRAHVLPLAIEDFDMVNAMTNLVVQAARKMDLPSWLPLRELSSGSDNTAAIRRRLLGFLNAETKAVILGVAHVGAVSDVEHTESARWLRALSMESRLLRWVACSDYGLLHDRFIEARKPTFTCWWQTVEDRVLLCADVPTVTSSQQFLDDLATHLRITTGLALLLHTATCPHRPTDAPVGTSRGAQLPGRGSGTGPLCHGAGVHHRLVVGGGPCQRGGAERWTNPPCGTGWRP